MNRWASRALGTSASEFLAASRSEIPVALIATARADLKCQRKDRWQQIESDRALADFDQVPLTDDNDDHIIAVFIRGTGPVWLRENMFMASGAPLISFLESADQHKFRLLLKDRTVSGMVTLSDVQKLPVYSVLFSLLIVVEMLLMDCIRRVCGANQDQWLKHLDKRQRGTIEKHWNNAVKKNLAIDRLSCASFGQEIRAAVGLGLFKGHDEHYTNLTDLEALRHMVCHATEFAPTPEQALTIPCRVREAQAATTWLQAQIRASSA